MWFNWFVTYEFDLGRRSKNISGTTQFLQLWLYHLGSTGYYDLLHLFVTNMITYTFWIDLCFVYPSICLSVDNSCCRRTARNTKPFFRKFCWMILFGIEPMLVDFWKSRFRFRYISNIFLRPVYINHIYQQSLWHLIHEIFLDL